MAVLDQFRVKVNSKDTAQCQNCFIDSVIGDASGIPITNAFLKEMHKKWFD